MCHRLPAFSGAKQKGRQRAVQVEFEVVIKLLKLVETHVLVIIVEPGTKIMDPEIKRSRLNMKASLTHYEHSTIFGTQHN